MTLSPDPIAFILEQHERQLAICDRLEDLITIPIDQLEARSVHALLDFLTTDLPDHIEDEERDLFPILGARLADDQNLSVILDQLILEHELDRDLVEPIVEGLRLVVDGGDLVDPTVFYASVMTFAEAMRRHLNWENRVILPLAETVLSEDDRLQLGERIAARRHKDP